MAVIIDLPREVEEHLRAQTPDLDARGKEAMLVELYRQDALSHHELGLALGLDRLETDALLKRHRVNEDLITPQEYDAALTHLSVSAGS